MKMSNRSRNKGSRKLDLDDSPLIAKTFETNMEEVSTKWLRISPSFKVTFSQPSTQMLNLRNMSDRRICWKVKTTAPRDYIVKPNAGFLEAGDAGEVAVTLRPSYDARKSHRFLIQALPVDEGVKDREEVWKVPASTLGLNKNLQNEKLIVILPKVEASADKSGTSKGSETGVDVNGEANRRIQQLDVDLLRLTKDHELLLSKVAELEVLMGRVPRSRSRFGKIVFLVVLLVCALMASAYFYLYKCTWKWR